MLFSSHILLQRIQKLRKMEKQQVLKFIVMVSIMLGLLVGPSTADGTWDCYEDCFYDCVTGGLGIILQPTACHIKCAKQCAFGGTSLESMKDPQSFCKLGCVTSKCTRLDTKEKPGNLFKLNLSSFSKVIAISISISISH